MGGTPADVIRSAEERLRTARFGLEDMSSPHRAHSGLYNAVVFGRMVTFALQNLRSTRSDFDDWYAPKQEQMKADPLMRYFHELRTKIEKEVGGHTTSSLYIRQLTPADIKRFYPGPPGALGFFLGDANGGAGWTIGREDGGVDKYYIDLPPEIGTVTLHLADVPDEFKRLDAKELVSKYLDWLDGLIRDAKNHFLPATIQHP